MLAPGQQYGRLRVLARRIGGYVCLCQCGRTILATRAQLVHERARHCGCGRRQQPLRPVNLSLWHVW